MRRLDGLPILTAAEMRAAEDRAIAAGTSVEALMERAGTAVADTVARFATGSEVLILCGPGNNGGDGYVAARRLAAGGHAVRVAAFGASASAAASVARQGWAGPVEPLETAAPAAIIVDALFGTGMSRSLEDATVAALARLVPAAGLSIAVDLPSGVGTDDGALLGAAHPIDLVLALGAAKPAHVLQPAAALMREVRVLDIGVPVGGKAAALARPRIAGPTADDHKYTRGMVAVVAGAMPGAGALAAIGTAHGGAGYVLLLGSATDRLPHAIVRRRYDPALLTDSRIGAVVIGPGLGREGPARDRIEDALVGDRPLVIDGDALRLIDLGALSRRAAPTILTPHAGEFTHLFGAGPGSKIERTRIAAKAANAIVVHKGPDTVIAAPDGSVRIAVERAPWLSTAGTGDVLAGVIAVRLAATGDPLAAASEGVWLHTAAARSLGPAFLADDLAAALPGALSRCLAS